LDRKDGIGIEPIESIARHGGHARLSHRRFRRHERAGSPELVVRSVAQLGESFERKSNPLDVGIGRVNEL